MPDNDNPAADQMLAQFTPTDETFRFAAFLTHHLMESVTEHGLTWTEAVYAAGLAVRAIGEVAALMVKNDDGARKFSPEQTTAIATRLIARAMQTKVDLLKVNTIEEFDAMKKALDGIDAAVRH